MRFCPMCGAVMRHSRSGTLLCPKCGARDSDKQDKDEDVQKEVFDEP